MTPQEEIELIVNTVYLRGCDSNFKTAIAAMQESEKDRLSRAIVWINECGDIDCEYYFLFTAISIVYGTLDSYDAVNTINSHIRDDERERLAELVKMIKEQSPN